MDERELANHVLTIVDQTAYRLSARRILGVHLSVGGRRGFNLASNSETPCPECSHPHTEIIAGEELRVTNMDIDDTMA